MKTVDILHRVDRTHHPRLVDLIWQGRLDEDAVHAVVVVQPGNDLEDVVLGGVGRQPCVKGLDPGRRRRLVLEPDVDVGGRIVADQHRRESDMSELRHLVLHLGTDARGESLAVHQRGRHCRP